MALPICRDEGLWRVSRGDVGTARDYEGKGRGLRAV